MVYKNGYFLWIFFQSNPLRSSLPYMNQPLNCVAFGSWTFKNEHLSGQFFISVTFRSLVKNFTKTLGFYYRDDFPPTLNNNKIKTKFKNHFNTMSSSLIDHIPHLHHMSKLINNIEHWWTYLSLFHLIINTVYFINFLHVAGTFQKKFSYDVFCQMIISKNETLIW